MRTYGKIVSCIGRVSKKGAKQLVVQLIARDQDCESEEVIDRFFRVFSYPTRSEGAMADLRAFMDACGMTGGSIDPKDLIGKIVGVQLEQREWQGQMRWSVSYGGYFTIKDEHVEGMSQAVTDYQRAAGSQPTGESDEKDYDFTVAEDKNTDADADDDAIVF